jgi:cation:H+ antiporter
MSPLLLHLLGFAFCGLIIVLSGSRLSHLGDALATRTGMGKAWFGLVLMASVTSMPELVTGISSIALVQSPDLAVGDVLGSCVFNLLILSILDVFTQKPLFSLVRFSHVVSAIFGIVLLSIAGISIFMAQSISSFFWVSLSTLVIVGVYVGSVWGIYQFEAKQAEEPSKSEDFDQNHKPISNLVLHYLFHAVIVLIAASFLPVLGEKLAVETGLGNTLFGTLFLAGATSLPELVVSFAAIRMGSPDMAVGNLLGSNIFNMFILALDDVVYTHGSLFTAVSSHHLLSVFLTICMSSVVVLGLLFKPSRKQVWVLGLDTFALFVLYLILLSFLFLARTP